MGASTKPYPKRYERAPWVASPAIPAKPSEESKKKIASTKKKSAAIACFVCGEMSLKNELFCSGGGVARCLRRVAMPAILFIN